ncbi:hypothetical protein EIP91_008163 [Steccherinum ochraceum]|uniref:AA9 family lytic polysaccharide monooxygenase n=1 Tax=Steccherinum ochraceum TaxID=92696 RepID=A0A4R0RBF6_9APHY|nr:hypothetical protein EIP91_008163 [Steccherinum ochraceum]
MTRFASIAVFAALATSAFAHTIMQELYFNGVDQGHINGIRVPDYDGPITDVTSNDVICNGGINPFHQPISKSVLTVAAGSQVTTEWHHTLSGADPSDPADPIDPSHKGPVLVPDATQSTVTGLKWFKIYEDGLDSSGQWGVDRLIANKGKVTFTLPSCIPAGQYLLRAEIIALHAASSYPGAQLYMECGQLQVTGGGSASPATVSFPGAYKGSDPGITVNIYYPPLTSYKVPGPAVFSCDGSSAPPPPPPTSVPPTSVPPTSVPPTSVPPTSTPPTGPTVPKYGQCGGQGAIAVFAALATSAFAHTIMQELYINGVDQGHINGIRVPDYDGPITDLTSNDVICNGGINPYHQPVSQMVLTAAAGSQITTEWHHTLDGADPSDPADPIDPGHKGPVLVYLAKIPDATQTDVTGLKWFKIYEDGMDSSGQWGVDRLVAAKGKTTFTLPDCIAAGQYLLRAEIIALHAASTYPGAQLYMECAQLQITGGGNTSPATVSFPGAYAGTDPGIKVDIYYPPLTSYTIPGPPVFSCDGSSAPVPPSSAPATSAPHTSAPATSVPSSAPTSTGAVAPKYGQCGGQGCQGPAPLDSETPLYNMKAFASLAALASLAGFVSARTVFSEFAVNGVDQGHAVAVRVPSSNAPVTDVTSDNLICNTGFIQPVSKTVATVPAGSTITAMFHHTSAGYTGPDPADPLDPTDKGPVLAYLAKIPDATQTAVTGLSWFKVSSLAVFSEYCLLTSIRTKQIWQDGLETSTGQWGSDHLFINKGNATFTIPSSLANAESYPGAEFYMSCAQINITGGNKVQPVGVQFPGAYKSTDPGIVTNIYGETSYTPPGPAVFQC